MRVTCVFYGKEELKAVWYSLEKASNISFFLSIRLLTSVIDLNEKKGSSFKIT